VKRAKGPGSPNRANVRGGRVRGAATPAPDTWRFVVEETDETMTEEQLDAFLDAYLRVMLDTEDATLP